MSVENHSPNAVNPWPAPVASAAISATVALPGSKSLTNRELVLSALADEPTLLTAPLHSRDSALMIDALTSLGAQIQVLENGDVLVTPGAVTGGAKIDCGLAGTVMRFVPPMATLANGDVYFDGDAAARRRPIHTTVDSLRALGVQVEDAGTGSLPFTVKGTGKVRGAGRI